MQFRNFFLFLLLLAICSNVFGQQDVDFHISNHFFAGKKILKARRDIRDPYLWVLAENNGVYRINSQTMLVDDYTAKFAAYHNEPIVDIDGYNKDTVGIVTKTKLIICCTGVVTRADAGLLSNQTVNSIGMNNFVFASPIYGLLPGFMIGTEAGGYFDYTFPDNKIATIDAITTPGYARIYEATYRRLMYSDYSTTFTYGPNTSTMIIDDETEIRGTCILKGGQFGTRPNTAFYTTTSYRELRYAVNMFWGTDDGFFNFVDPYYIYGVDLSNQPYHHYLPGIKVNKIVDLYGLTSINSRDTAGNLIPKENLLIGTANGLYFSKSVLYDATKVGLLDSAILFHYDAMGQVRVNDINVNASATSTTGIALGCEDGVWAATDDGLYYLKPDYGEFIGVSTRLQALTFDLPNSDTVTQVQICPGSNVNLLFNSNSVGNNLLQWQKDGKDIVGQTNDTLSVKETGNYNVVLYNTCSNVHIATNHLKVAVLPTPVFSFNYPDKIALCGNTPTPLKTDYNPLYHYRWYTNGILNGDTISTYQVTQTGKYKVEVSACANSWVASKEVEVDLVTLPVPQITMDKPIHCAGDVASLTVSVPNNNSYTINWYRDGELLTADDNLTTIQDTTTGSYTVSLNSTIAAHCSQSSSAQSLSFVPAPYFTRDLPDEYRSCELTVPITITSAPQANAVYQYRWYTNGVLNGSTGDTFTVDKSGKYRVEMSTCAGSWASSHEVHIDLVNLPLPTISTDKPVYCIGDNATLSVNVPADASYTINWYRDGELLTADINQTSLITNVAGNYTVSVVNNLTNSDGTTCIQTSTMQALAFNAPATLTIEQVMPATICDGQTINLLAHYSGGTLKWSTGETSDQIGVTTAGVYKATVTTAAGCQKDTSITVTFLPNPILSVKDTTICPYKGVPVVLTAPPGFAKYTWNGVPGNQTYQVSQPQTVNLTVTDNNGCQTTLPIKVLDHCPDIWIPNTFTPNGDGINDNWVIEGLDSDPTVLVSVYTRYGGLVFQSKGYGSPWNGQYEGKKLPAGVYYYLVNAKNGSQKFSGSLTIIY